MVGRVFLAFPVGSQLIETTFGLLARDPVAATGVPSAARGRTSRHRPSRARCDHMASLMPRRMSQTLVGHAVAKPMTMPTCMSSQYTGELGCRWCGAGKNTKLIRVIQANSPTSKLVRLRAHASHRNEAGRGRVIVATDNDAAGQRAAHKAFWALTDRGLDPRRLSLPNGTDPADLLAAHGPGTLSARLHDATPLADVLIDEALAPWAEKLDTPDGRVHAVRAVVPVIAALPADQWTAHLAPVVARIGVDPVLAIEQLVDAHQTRTAATGRSAPGPDGDAAPVPVVPAEQRWAALAEATLPGVTEDVDWPSLAAALDRAEASGYGVRAGLPGLAARPLPHDYAARSLEYRLANAWPASLTDSAQNPSLHPRRHDPSPSDTADEAAIPMPWNIEPGHRRGL